MKKPISNAPQAILDKFPDAESDLTEALTEHSRNCRDPDCTYLESLGTTTRKPAGRHSLFMVREGAGAEETLLHVSLLLKCAEEVSDEITEEASGVERGLIWSMIHSVEMARALVDALLDGRLPGEVRSIKPVE